MVIKYLLKFPGLIFFCSTIILKQTFKDITSKIDDNFRLSYGISVTDVNQDNKYEFDMDLDFQI